MNKFQSPVNIVSVITNCKLSVQLLGPFGLNELNQQNEMPAHPWLSDRGRIMIPHLPGKEEEMRYLYIAGFQYWSVVEEALKLCKLNKSS